MTFTDEASDAQVNWIMRLLDERAVTGKMASRIIQMLEDCPDRNNMGSNAAITKAVKGRIERDDK